MCKENDRKQKIIQAAKDDYECDDIQIDNLPSVEEVEDGAWVQARVFVNKKEYE